MDPKSKDWLLTHSYDKLISKDLITKITRETNKIDNIDKIANILQDKIKDPIAKIYLDKMLIDNNNYDAINNLDSLKLLYLVALIAENNDNIIPLLIEQLKDLQTGFCPQGRTIRLIQIIQPFLN